MSWRLLIMGLWLGAGLYAATAEEELAGENVAVPTAVPTPMGDERGPVQATRTAQAASSFDLPAFVVTGTGERQSLARRQDMSGALDTSGGIKASPGEQGAGKDQLEAQAERESLDSLSGTSRPWAGGLRLGAGYQPGYDAQGYLAQELGPWFWSLDGDAAYSEGGPIQAPMRDAALSDEAALRARAGWRGEGGWTLSAYAEGGASSRAPQPYLAGQTASLRRSALQGGLDAEGLAWGLGVRQRAAGGRWSAVLPGLDLSEDQAALDLDLSRRFSGRTGSALLEAAFSVDASSLAWAGQRRSRTLLRGTLLSRFDIVKGSRLGLGLALDAVSGDDQALQLGPLLRFDQRLLPSLSLQAGVDSGLRLSRLKPDAGLVGPAWHAPDPTLKPARLSLDGRAGLHWQPGAGWAFSLGAFSQEGEDWFLPAASAQSVLAVDTAVRGWRLLGLRLGQSWRKDGWWQSAEAVVQSAELRDLDAWATLLPQWSAALAGGFQHGPWKAELSLALLGPRHGALDGSLPLEPSADLGALISYDLDAAWTFFAEGRNLAVQRVQAAPSYPKAAPYAGLGVEYRF